MSKSTGAPALRDCEAPIEAGPELLWRQVHPNFTHANGVSAEAFVGTPGDRDQVSVARSSTVSAASAYAHHTDALSLASAGTWAISVNEVSETGSRAIDDMACDDVDTPGHAYVDMRAQTKKERKLTRARLASAATLRGCQHPPTSQ
ncbi:MAG TPA: hypothetical protein VNS09_23285 [Solirubrobacter sp.]|nr:hypothetical protein [Solirubrobacter sp.]